MARRGSSRRSAAAASYVRSGDSFLESRLLGLPRSSALLTAGQEDEALRFVRHSDFVASARARAVPAKPVLLHAKLTGGKPYLSKLAMVSPRRVLFCLRRKIRKEVLFALRKNGRNGGRVYRRRQESQYAC